MTIKLVVGLGNPGPEYADNRHNAGFMAVDELARELRATYWKSEHGALTAHVKRGGQELILAKPQSYMNTSGGPVSKIAAAYKIAPEEILVIHDELDIPNGDVRVKVGGGHGGHNGLRSIHDKLGSNAYARVRVGIDHPPGRKPVADYVLQAPRGEEGEAFRAATHGRGSLNYALARYAPVEKPDEIIREAHYNPLEADSPDSVFCSHGAGYSVPWNEVRAHAHCQVEL